MHINELIIALDNELTLSEDERGTGASSSSLQSVITLLRRADHSIALGQSETAKKLLEAAARQVSDSWSFSSVLGAEVLVRAAEDETTGSDGTPRLPKGLAEMNTDVETLTMDMTQFASLLSHMGQTTLGKNYQTKAVELQSASSEQDIEALREWVRTTLKGGAGGLFDLYVQNADGSPDRVLDQRYRDLLQRMSEFANGDATPVSPLIKQMGNTMFANGYTYFRQIEAPVRKGLLRTSGRTMYEVMTAPGVTAIVEAKLLGSVVGYDPRGSRRDMHECQMQARKLYSEGRSDDWVHFSSSQIVPGELLRDSE